MWRDGNRYARLIGIAIDSSIRPVASNTHVGGGGGTRHRRVVEDPGTENRGRGNPEIDILDWLASRRRD